MAETNRSTEPPNEYTPLYAKPRSEAAVYDLAELEDAQSSSNSSEDSFYVLCNHADCDCASQRRPSTPPAPQSDRPRSPRARFAPAPARNAGAGVPAPAATSSGSTSSDGYGAWHVAEYNLEYAAWRAIERRPTARADGEDSDRGWWSWLPCFPRPSSTRLTSTTLDEGAQGEERHAPSSSQEPAPAERMVYPAPDIDDRNDERASNAGESRTMDVTCSVSWYVIKFPARRDRLRAAGSSSRSRGRAMAVESVVDSGEEAEEEAEAEDPEVTAAEERVAAA